MAISTENVDAGSDSPRLARAQIKEAIDTVNNLETSAGAAFVGADDGASGSLWTTVQGFINYIKTYASGLFSQVDLLAGRATNLLVRNKTAGATRVHIEPNGIVDSGTASKLDLMASPFEDDIDNYAIQNFYIQNGDSWSTGWPVVNIINSKGVGGYYGAFPPMVFGFNDLNSSAAGAMKIMYVDKADSTIYAPHKGAWRAGRSITTNDYITSVDNSTSPPNYILYKATTTGTTGATAPIHLAGTASDGGVTWQFIKNYTTVAQAGNFLSMVLFGRRDDTPVAGTTYNVQYARGAAFQDTQHCAHLNSAGALVGRRQNIGNDIYDYFYGATHLMRYTDTYAQHQSGSWLNSVKTNTDNSAALDCSAAETVLLSNTNPTTITTVSSTIHQTVVVRATNGNTTLQHSASLYLRGGVDRVLRSGEVAFFYAGASNNLMEIGATQSRGSFTLGAAATTAVSNTLVTANSFIKLTPTNAAAATLMSGAKSLYVSAKTALTSFTVATADATNAAGTETFDYEVVN